MKRFPAKKKIDPNPFGRKTRKWFLERIGFIIAIKHPAGYEATLIIEGRTHADVLYKTRQNKDGYLFSDISTDEKINGHAQ